MPSDTTPVLTHIRFVLVAPTHPGNIGGVARAMKTMGLHRLVLVRPKCFPDEMATAMAAGADDILQAAIVADSLPEAIADCALAVATSARRRYLDWPEWPPDRMAREVLSIAAQQETAVVFGRESSGLSNDELDLCHSVLRIPTNDDFGSLNLAAAAQLVAYELRRQWMMGVPCPADEATGAPVQSVQSVHKEDLHAEMGEMENFYGHLQLVLHNADFFSGKDPRRVMRRFRRLFSRVRVSRREVGLLRGLLSACERPGNAVPPFPQKEDEE